MENRDYVILFDENGQPYIAHTLWQRAKTMASGRVSKGASRGTQGVGRGVRTAHKYIEKWGEGAKARYFYTQEELKAALNQGRQKVSKAASSARQAVGNAAARGRAALTTASEKAHSAASSVSTKARDLSSRTSSVLQRHGSELLSSIKSGATTVRDKAAEKVKGAADKARDAVEKAKETGSAVKDKAKEIIEMAKDKAGVDELQRLKIGVEKANNTINDMNADDKQAQRVVDKAQKLFEEYADTPLGKTQFTVAKVAAIAASAGVAITAVPVIALTLPIVAGAAVAKAAQLKIADIKEDFAGTRYKQMAEEARSNGDAETAKFWEEVYKNNSGMGKIETAREKLDETLESVKSRFKRK